MMKQTVTYSSDDEFEHDRIHKELDGFKVITIKRINHNFYVDIEVEYVTQEGKTMPKIIKEWKDLDGLKSYYKGTPLMVRLNRDGGQGGVLMSVSVVGAVSMIERDTICVVDKSFPTSKTREESVKYLRDAYGFDIILAPQFSAEQFKHIHAAKLSGMNWVAKDEEGDKVFAYHNKPIKFSGKRYWLISEDGGNCFRLTDPIWQTIVTSTTEPFELFGEGA